MLQLALNIFAQLTYVVYHSEVKGCWISMCMLLAIQETGDLSNSRYKYLNNINTFEDTNQQRNKGCAQCNNGKEKHYVHTI